MKIVRSKAFRADRAWGALDIAKMNGITTRLHWTDRPYRWHVNDGEEVFAVLDGQVEMRYREGGGQTRHGECSRSPPAAGRRESTRLTLHLQHDRGMRAASAPWAQSSFFVQRNTKL